jgi:DNA repair protein RadC
MHELPRERCLSQGASALSLRECVALVLGTGPRAPAAGAASSDATGGLRLARHVVERVGGRGLADPEAETAFFNRLEQSPEAPLRDLEGLGQAGQARLLAALELGRRYALHRERRQRSVPAAPRDDLPERALARIPWEWRADAREWLGFVPVRADGSPGSFCWVEKGVRTHVNTDPAALFASILALRPAGFFLFHNHPSGDLRPSEPDRELTRRVCRLAGQLGVPCLGHALVTSRDRHWIVV